MMFTKCLFVVDDDVNVHDTSEVLFHLCANTDPRRDSIFTKGPSDVLDHATSEVARAKVSSVRGRHSSRRCRGESEGGKVFRRNRVKDGRRQRGIANVLASARYGQIIFTAQSNRHR